MVDVRTLTQDDRAWAAEVEAERDDEGIPIRHELELELRLDC
jgi:hypothetical protein